MTFEFVTTTLAIFVNKSQVLLLLQIWHEEFFISDLFLYFYVHCGCRQVLINTLKSICKRVDCTSTRGLHEII